MLPWETHRAHTIAFCCLLGSAFCSAFGPGFQSAPILSWIQPTLLLIFLGRTRTGTSLGVTIGWWTLGIIVQAAACTFAFARIFADSPSLYWVSGGMVFAVCLLLQFLLVVLCYCPYLTLRTRFIVQGYRPGLNNIVPLVLPTITTSVYFLLSFTPLGDTADFVYSQMDNASLIQVSSLFGISFVRFLIFWFATLMYDLVESQPMHPSLMRHCTYFSVIFLFALTFGGLANTTYGGVFYQTPIEHSLPTTIDVSCIVGYEKDDMLRRTQEFAESGAKLILWSESAVAILDSKGVAELQTLVGDIAKQYSVYVGMTYLNWVDDNKTASNDKYYNTFALINDEGFVNMTYHKAHPVPSIEADVKAGPYKLQWVDTPYGRIGAAICFDFNYPTFIRQAGKDGVDIMLQPSWTWGPLGKFHARQNAVRAAEQGFTMFRCTRGGYSGVFTPAYETLALAGIDKEGSFSTKLPILPRRKTLYGAIGDVFSWFCIVFTFVYWLLCLPQNFTDPVLDKVSFWRSQQYETIDTSKLLASD